MRSDSEHAVVGVSMCMAIHSGLHFFHPGCETFGSCLSVIWFAAQERSQGTRTGISYGCFAWSLNKKYFHTCLIVIKTLYELIRIVDTCGLLASRCDELFERDKY